MYRAPVDEIAFTLWHVAGLKAALESRLFGDLGEDVVDAVLAEAGIFRGKADRDIAISNWSTAGKVRLLLRAASDHCRHCSSELRTGTTPLLRRDLAAGLQPVQYEDLSIARERRPKSDGFGELGNEEMSAAFAVESV